MQKEKIKNKSIVIAGNGPSLAQIDYRRLPADFDVFRCNQFYFEDKYFLGKKVTGAFFNPKVVKYQYYTLKELEKRGEYEIENKYCACLWPHWEDEENYPTLKNTFFFLQQLPEFYEMQRFLWVYYMQSFTSTINMLISALALGYREIYLIGLDFYAGGGANYAFDSQKKNLIKYMPQMGDAGFKDPMHSMEIDIMGLEIAKAMPHVQLYCLCEHAPLANYLPLAPVVNERPNEVQEKGPHALKDFADLPRPYSHFGPVRRFVDKYDLWLEYEELMDNIFIHALRNMISLFKILMRMLRKVLFPQRKKSDSAWQNKKKKRKNI